MAAPSRPYFRAVALDQRMAFGNLAFLNPADFERLGGKLDTTLHVRVGRAIFNARSLKGTRPGQIQLGLHQRKAANVAMTDDLDLEVVKPDQTTAVNTMVFAVSLLTKGTEPRGPKVDRTAFVEHVGKTFSNQVLQVGQEVNLEVDGLVFVLQVREFTLMMGPDGAFLPSAAVSTSATTAFGGLLVSGSGISLVKTEKKGTIPFELIGGPTTKVNRIFDPGFSFENLGIGGLDTEFAEIFRRAFASRLYPGLMRELGMTHVRGMLLHGPPGCGKSLIAAKIGEALKAREPKLVNGPEILNKYVGQSEENIRALFADAEADEREHGDESDLHIIIFDEIDAICKQRGSSRDSTGVHDSIVNQLLSKIQGVHSLNNILLIGMTNRKDMIDEALLRPGRLEVHVEIGLPDAAGRLSILNIHTKKFRGEKKRLADDVDLVDVAERTKNYTGAELEGLVKNALGFALSRLQTTGDITKVGDPEKVCVTRSDFDRAVLKTTPAFGQDSAAMQDCAPCGIIPFSAEFARLMVDLQTFTRQVATNARTPLLSVLLEGPAGCGKTAIAATCAGNPASGFGFAKVVSSDTMVSMSESSKAQAIHKVFEDAYKSPLSVIVLDDLERLLDYVPLGQRFSNVILQTLLVLCKRPPPKGRRLFILGTTANAQILGEMGLAEAFTIAKGIPLLDTAGLKTVLTTTHSMPAPALEAIAAVITKPVGIKKALLALELASQSGTLTAASFQEACAMSGVAGTAVPILNTFDFGSTFDIPEGDETASLEE